MIPGVSTTRDADGGDGVEHGVGEEVHLDARGAAGTEQLDAAGDHPGAHVGRGQPGLGGPHDLVQPAHQREVAAHAAQHRHRRVAVRVDQPREQRPRAARRPVRPPAGAASRGPDEPGDPPVGVDVDHTVADDGAAGVARQYDRSGEAHGYRRGSSSDRSDRNGGSQAPARAGVSRVIRGSGSRKTPSMSSRSRNEITSEVRAKLACSRKPMTVTSRLRLDQGLQRLPERTPVAGGHHDVAQRALVVGAPGCGRACRRRRRSPR